MRKRVKVSVIVPVYNVESYLPYAMQSLLDQTLMDVEFICVNDGSTDGSLKILEMYAERDSRITIINKENGGLSSARNAGIKASMGEIIMFMDSDDYLDKNACERVWIEFKEGPTDIVVFGTNPVPNTPCAPSWYWWNLIVESNRYYGFNPGILFDIPSSKPFVWRQAFSSTFLEEVNVLFDESVKFGEDIIFQFQVFPFAKNVAYISDPLYFYRWQRTGSLMETVYKESDSLFGEHINIVSKIFNYFSEKKLFEKYEHRVFQWALEFLGNDLFDKKKEEGGKHIPQFMAMLDANGAKDYFKKFSNEAKETYRKLEKLL